MKIRKRKGLLLLAAVLLCALLLAGCTAKYKTVDVPAIEEAKGGLSPAEGEETSAVAIGETAQSSSHEASVTTETAPDFVPVDETVYVTGNNVNLRSAPSSLGEILGTLSKGTSLKRTGTGDGWSRVSYENKEGYVASQYLSAKEPAKEPAKESSKTGNGRLIAIDPGHQAKGNSEKEPIGPGASEMKAKVASGTQGVSTGLPEYKLNLSVSLKLKEELLKRGYQVYMIRETHDVNISNAERAEMANQSGADLFIRIHANSLNDSSVHGTLTMCQTSKNPYNGDLYSKSSALSKAVVNGISQTTGFKNRGVQETDSMSGINWCRLPVTIVEMGFMSNAEEDQKMASEEYQNKIAKGIADGIDAYYGSQNP